MDMKGFIKDIELDNFYIHFQDLTLSGFFPFMSSISNWTHLQFTCFLNTNSMDYFNTDLFCFPVVSEIPVWSPQLDTFSNHIIWSGEFPSILSSE